MLTFSLVTQGLCAGGAITFLHSSTNTKAVTDKKENWDNLILEINHILLLLGYALRQAGMSMYSLPAIAGNVFLITPVFLTIAYLRRNETTTHNDLIQKIDQFHAKFYYGAAIACSIALCLLGNVSFALGSLGFVVLDHYIQQGHFAKYATPFKVLKVALAILALAGFGFEVLTTASFIYKASMLLSTLLITVISAPKIYDFITKLLPASSAATGQEMQNPASAPPSYETVYPQPPK